MKRNRYDRAVEQLADVLGLDDDAIAVAEGWSILPPSIQRHFKLLIDDYVANLHPLLTEMYANAKEDDQLRFNRIVERVQCSSRRRPPDGTATEP